MHRDNFTFLPLSLRNPVCLWPLSPSHSCCEQELNPHPHNTLSARCSDPEFRLFRTTTRDGQRGRVSRGKTRQRGFDLYSVVLYSNLSRETGCSVGFFRFSSVAQEKCRDSTSNRSWSFPCRSLAIHRSVTILPSEAM
jgi:hypothetical protein